MNKLAISRRFIFTVFAVLMAANLWGQATLLGNGEEESPYLINDATDWETFASWINAGTNASKYYQLTSDITVSTIVGTNSKKFNGTFDGNWHTLTFNNGSLEEPCTVEKCAPFGFVGPGTTIKNLTVEGTIISKKKFAAGLIGWVEGTTSSYYIINCTSNITINCSKIEQGASNKKYDCSTAGFIGQIESGNVYFENCIFEGLIDKGTQNSANRCAGFVSYINSGHIYYTNCAMAGSITLTSNISTFNRNNKNTFSEAYYINNYGDVTNCTQATETEPTTVIAKNYLRDSKNYFVPKAIITGLETTTYPYDKGHPVTITPVVTYCGNFMTRGTDYIIKIDGTEVPTETTPTLDAVGDYTLTIEGKTGSSYAGSQTTTIRVVSFNYDTWAGLQEVLADATQGDRIITLSGNITPALGTDVALEVNGTVVLNLNGKTIDRGLTEAIVKGQVIRVNSGANLTINGPGTIKGGFNIAENDTESGVNNDGGGIYNKGILVLNNVDVTHNTCVKMTNNSNARTARGGGIYTGSGSSFTMTGGSISNNDGKGGGGGIHCDNATVFEMDNVTIDWNICESKGAGIRVNTSNNHTAYLLGCEVTGNFLTSNSEAKGGGVYLGGGDLYMENCIINGNSSNKQGAGFFSMNGTTTAKNCEIYWNGTNYPDDDNLGGGICLYDNASQGNHSIYIMDGGSVYENNSIGNGGGIYIYDGAEFRVKGNVQILDNYMASVSTGPTNNNAYLDGTTPITVIAPGLGADAIITITPHGDGGTYVTFAEGASTTPAQDLSHFILDNNNTNEDEYSSMIDEYGKLVIYETYDWSNAATWDGTVATDVSGTVPASSEDVTINRAVKIPSDYTAYAKDITLSTYGSIIIEDGGQLENNNAVAVTAKKNVVRANAENQYGWYLISSPVANPNIANKTNLITTESDPSYDLYRFNQAAENQWENYRGGHGDFTTLENCRGYLYRNAKAHTIDIDGTLNVSDITYNLSCSGSGDLQGFNLIGNPYSQNITLLNTTLVDNSGNQIVDGESHPINLTGFYRLSKDDGSWGTEITSTSATIAPLEGILVQVDEPRKVKFSKTARGGAKSNGDNIKFTVANSQYEDVAYALFENGLGLNKIEHMNEDVPMIYININDEDFAVATLNDEVKLFDLNFEAKTTGRYTLSVKPQGEFSYLHLYDKLTGEDVDMLQDGEYSFIGSTADNADRFVVRLGNVDNDETPDIFAYQSGDEIIVSGVGELQVFDVMGRLVAQKHVSGVETQNVASLQTGVYILRLNDKTQKIVID